MLVMGPEWPGKLATLVRSYGLGMRSTTSPTGHKREKMEFTKCRPLSRPPPSFREGPLAGTAEADGPVQEPRTTPTTPHTRTRMGGHSLSILGTPQGPGAISI